ncbi:hypothetical protein B0H14DRAFT_2566121 [Mycena olivaceomarginata]|nr:hypothetical protein B0H14DRAFT_2566121 [Mycena olivaceomarginata]
MTRHRAVNTTRVAGLSARYLHQLVSWITRSLCNGFTDSRHKAFKKCMEAERLWADLCATEHRGGCPAFEPVTFTLDPPANTHPSSVPCTIPILGLPPRVVLPTQEPTSRVLPMPAGSPFTSTVSGSLTLSGSSASLGSSTSSGTASFISPAALERPAARYTPHSGAAHTDQPGLRQRPQLLNAKGTTRRNPPPQRPLVLPSRLSTRRPVLLPRSLAPPSSSPLVATDANTALIAAVPATPGACPIVAVFYHSHAAALAAAHSLNRPTAKIMVSDNIEKLEAWMFGKPFVGEDEDA